jgi:prevent-host-death family protein
VTKSNIHEAKSRLSQLIELANAGEEVIICKAGKPVVRLVPYSEKRKPRKLGIWKGKVRIAPDFDILPPSLAAAFRGERE